MLEQTTADQDSLTLVVFGLFCEMHWVRRCLPVDGYSAAL